MWKVTNRILGQVSRVPSLVAICVLTQACGLKLLVDDPKKRAGDDLTAALTENESVELVSISPSSPTNSGATPVAVGASNSDIVSVNLYSDLACSDLIGSGTLADWTSGGISFTRLANDTTYLHTRALLKSGKLTACEPKGVFVHDDQAPDAPNFSSTDPVTPTNLTTAIRVIGTAPADANTVTIFNGAGCAVALESGPRAEFEGAGILVNIAANATTALYMKSFDDAGNNSGCTFALNAIHDNTGPTSPTFISTSPSSPSNSDTSPEVIGSASADTVRVRLYSDSSCTAEVADVTKATFEGVGATVNVAANASTGIYAKGEDSLGNLSTACALMTTYVHDNLAPSGPGFLSTDPASPSASSTTPKVIGTADADVVTVNLYSDAACTVGIGSSDRATFIGGGTTATVAANALTGIYAETLDLAGNKSSCTSLTAYRHDDTNPAAIATVTVPTWSNSTSSSPAISWTESSDAGSGLARYEYSIGTTSGGTNVVGWTSTVLVTSVTASGLTLSSGTAYYVNVRAFDVAGNTSSVTTASWTVDSVAPVGLGDPSATGLATLVQSPAISWTPATDPLSGILRHEYSIGFSSGGTQVRDWTATGAPGSQTATGLTLTDGLYYFNVRAVDNAGNVSAAKTVSFLVDATAPEIMIKSHNDGEAVGERFEINGSCESDLQIVMELAGVTTRSPDETFCDPDGLFSIIFDVDTESYRDGDFVRITLTQTDDHSNVGTATIDLQFDSGIPSL